jgi:hypothetical protein
MDFEMLVEREDDMGSHLVQKKEQVPITKNVGPSHFSTILGQIPSEVTSIEAASTTNATSIMQ